MKVGKKYPLGNFLADQWVEIANYSAGSIDAYTKLLIRGDAIADATGKTVTAGGNASVTTSQYKFSEVGASMVFDGNGDYLSLADSADWYLGTGDFTIDCWVRFNALPAVTARLYHHKNTGNSALITIQYNSTGSITFNVQKTDGSDLIFITSANTFSTGSWYHVAVVRNGSNWYLFVNGVSEASQSGISDAIADLNGTLYIGIHSDLSSYPFNGWLSQVRFSKGIARWTSNFTPPIYNDYYGPFKNITLSGLDGDTDIEYKLLIRTIAGVNGAYGYIRFNNDSGANYGVQEMYGQNTTIGSARYTTHNQLYLDYATTANNVSFIEIYLVAKSGTIREGQINRIYDITGTTIDSIIWDSFVWNNSANNLTSIVYTSSVTNGFGIGTHVSLFKKRLKS
jgi:hypothetical protein